MQKVKNCVFDPVKAIFGLLLAGRATELLTREDKVLKLTLKRVICQQSD
ncbi:hypothetical protein EDD80_11435 [Anseongella ginsenosidimutans]|uniref:Uncharacterized protein n=1 Tax=Anseongella ginsenosidimutans TaxID=496056 RepID=A0A4R3KN82_9SPHI|nr:hypothetical protein EDD80_11435 [Anseongella ginsenosidimutans]